MFLFPAVFRELHRLTVLAFDTGLQPEEMLTSGDISRQEKNKVQTGTTCAKCRTTELTEEQELRLCTQLCECGLFLDLCDPHLCVS